MDMAELLAVANCGECNLPEELHRYPPGTDPEIIAVSRALRGPCPAYKASRASVDYVRYLTVTGSRVPRRLADGRRAKPLPLHGACGCRHRPGECLLGSGDSAGGAHAARQGAIRARKALGTGSGDA